MRLIDQFEIMKKTCAMNLVVGGEYEVSVSGTDMIWLSLMSKEGKGKISLGLGVLRTLP